jgi:arabinose-5-phosphate isomerase
MSDLLNAGRRVLSQEAEAVSALANGLDDRFTQAAEMILQCGGRVITCGIGKSGHIARKTAGTLSSTGTPSGFLQAAEAVHGDLGMVTAGDVVILYSHSGETDELVRLFPPLRAIGAKTILISGRANSSAGRLADLVLETLVDEEACPNNLAPTTSTTVMLALSDALAIAVMERRGFSRDDFARFHPSGSLGKRLLLTVADVMRPLDEIAVVSPGETILETIRHMTKSHVGAACVAEGGALRGIVSESDLRRHLLKDPTRMDAPASEIMNPSAATIDANLLAVEALEAFQNYPIKIGEMPVVDHDRLVGLLVLKDLLRSGIV